MICQDEVRARATDRGNCLLHDGAFVDPSPFRGRSDQTVLPAHGIRREGRVESLSRCSDHVQIGKGGLHHHNVRTLLQVEGDLPERFAEVGGIFLVGAAVTEPGDGIRGLPERTVERGGMLRRVREDRSLLESLAVQGGADGGDLAVHHRTRGHEVRSGARLAHRGLREQLDRGVVADSPVPDHAAMPMVRVLAQTDI